MNLNSEDYYSCKLIAYTNFIESDAERRKGLLSPTPKLMGNDHGMVRDDNQIVESNNEALIEDMKKGLSNILVSIIT